MRRELVVALYDGGVDEWYDEDERRPHFTLARVTYCDPTAPGGSRVVRSYVTGPGFSVKLLLGGENLPHKLQSVVQKALHNFVERTGRFANPTGCRRTGRKVYKARRRYKKPKEKTRADRLATNPGQEGLGGERKT